MELLEVLSQHETNEKDKEKGNNLRLNGRN
jgi:hypothetical protein